MRYVALLVVGGALGFLLARFLLPVIFHSGVLFASLVLLILLVAALLFARALRRGRSDA